MHRAQTRLLSPAHGARGRPPPRDGQQPALAMTAQNCLSVTTHRLLARSEPFRRLLFLIPVSLGRGTRRSPHLRWHVPRPCPVARASPPSTPPPAPGQSAPRPAPGAPSQRVGPAGLALPSASAEAITSGHHPRLALAPPRAPRSLPPHGKGHEAAGPGPWGVLCP